MSGKDTAIHRLHPVIKLISTLVFIVTVVSFSRYDLGRLIPYIFYPTIIMALSDTPYGPLLKRFAVALPFCVLAGVSNLILDRGTAFSLGSMAISYGVLSFVSLILKTYLCVISVLLLVACTPVRKITAAMRQLKTPEIFVTLFEMTYRYIGTLIHETASMYRAYMQRSRQKKGLEMKHMGVFVGQLLLRSFDRSERIYNAMKCRGYASLECRSIGEKIKSSDWMYLIAVCGLSILFRISDMMAYMNQWIGGFLG